MFSKYLHNYAAAVVGYSFSRRQGTLASSGSKGKGLFFSSYRDNLGGLAKRRRASSLGPSYRFF
ncbi:UNVERIFIED_CONTAM: hypothetical protein Sradi_3290500 [Sesamum radiatum]|uniref:Uncharacterized protein n=1 Tax=Sesamum radiatum TaxID=300843 RepID=A0AAW2R1U2_SESRA